MKKALIFIETKNGEIKKSSQEALSVFLGTDYEVHTCAVGPEAEAVKEKLGTWGSTKHYFSNDDSVAQYNPETFQKFFAQAFEQTSPQLVVASSNMLGRDVFPRIAAQFDCAYMSDITELNVANDILCKRPLYAGKCTSQVTFTDESPKILLIRPNQIPVGDASQNATPEAIPVSVGATSGKTQLVSVEQGESEKLDLTEANTVVSGGRGLKDAENFKLLEDLAVPLNATVGASRAVVDLGWVPHSMQVGQTGKTVAPTLYIAAGISGAIQHLAGMSGSKYIVAINKDDKAPIFQKATYGIVGDLFEVLPLLTEKIKSVKN